MKRGEYPLTSGSQEQRRKPTQPANNLPRSIGSVIGRADAIAVLVAQLARSRLLTVVGPGGIGKTTVAIAVADSLAASFPDGVWFVPLAPVPTGDLVSSTIGAAVGLAAADLASLPAISAWLRDKRALILLDNCEHVIESAAAAVEALLKAAPLISILATSRESLRAEGEALHHLPPLTVPPENDTITASEALAHSAVQLFLDRAAASGGKVSLTDVDAPAISAICRRLDGLPLALELAAVQTMVFGIQGVASGLNDRFALLSRGRRTALPRQQTLRATMDWSHDLLSPIERTVLRRLSAFSGDFTMEAACAVAGDGEISELGVIQSIANLVTKSLIATSISAGVTSHYLLETMRVYAFEKLAESGEAEQSGKRHARYYRDLFEPAEQQRDIVSRDVWLATYARHLDNVRSALDWTFSSSGDFELGVSLTVAVTPLLIQLSLLSECRERVERALTMLSDGPATAATRMRLTAALGWSVMYSVGRARETSAAWTKTLALAHSLGDATYQRHALWALCIDQFNSGNMRTALSFAERFVGLVDGSNDPIEHMKADRIMATALHYLGDQGRARHHIDRALSHETAVESRPGTVSAGFDLVVSAHYFQARILWLQGLADQALRVIALNFEEGQAPGQALSFCSVLGQGACPIALLSGDLDAAAHYGAMLLAHTEQHPIRLWNIWARCFIGLVTAQQGEVESGIDALRQGLDVAGDARFLPRFLLLRGELARYLGAVGALDEALESVQQMLAACTARDEGWYMPELLRINAELVLMRDDPADETDAETLYHRSLEMAQKQDARAWELRTATSLARLWIEQQRNDEATALLGPIHARLTEGFATQDVRAAAEQLAGSR